MRHLCRELAAAAVVAATAMLSSAAASADTTSVVNALRLEGCDGAPAAAPVERDDRLDLVARALARARELELAIDNAAYPARSAASIHLRGPRDDAATRELLAENSCGSVGDARYDRIGVFEDGDEAWIVLAVRAPAPPELEPDAVAARVLELVNAARAEGRVCGADRFGAAAPLRLSEALNAAAAAHVWDMAANGYVGHDGSDGSRSGERITRAGYVWQAAGENVAAGQPDADSVVADWLESPGHCATLMAPYFTETGIAFAEARAKDPPIYWTQVFAAPRDAALQDPSAPASGSE